MVLPKNKYISCLFQISLTLEVTFRFAWVMEVLHCDPRIFMMTWNIACKSVFSYLNARTYYLEMQTCQSIFHRRLKLIRQRSDSQLSCYRYTVHYLGTKNIYFRWARLENLQNRKQMCTHCNIDLNYTFTTYTRHRKFFVIGGIQKLMF